MTKLPSPNQNVNPLRGEEYPPYKVGPICCVPGCSHFTDHTHHLWRRSFTIGACDWVKLWDDTVIGNVVGLCWRHHDEVTVDKAQIFFADDKVFYWNALTTSLPLDPQPPKLSRVTSNAGLVEPELGSEGHVHTGLGELCPTCHQRVRAREKTPSEETKPRGTWSVTVPKDRREDGADVLDVLLESARISLDSAGMSYGEQRNVRYYILSAALALFVQHADQILSDS